MKEAEVASSIVNAVGEAELALSRGNTGLAEAWLNVSRQWTYLLENVDLDYEPEKSDSDDDELEYDPEDLETNTGNSARVLDDFSHLIPAGLPEDDDDPDDIKRLGP